VTHATRQRRPPAAIQAATRSVREVVANRDIRAIEVAWVLHVTADAALLVVGLLIAYDLAGAWGVGLLGVARTLPATAVALAVDTAAARRPEQVLVLVNLAEAAATTVAVVAVTLGAPVVALTAIAVQATVGSLVRTAQFSLLPALAVTPSQLVSGNVVASLGESVGTVVGPLVAGIIAGALGTTVATGLAGAAFVGAAAAASRVRVAEAALPSGPERRRGLPVVLGLRAMATRPPLAMVMVSFGLQVVVRGALTTLIVLFVLEVLAAGEPSVGLLNSMAGVGGMVGAVGAFWLATRARLATIFAVALAGWGLPIAVVGLIPALGVAAVAMLVVGLSNALLDIAGFTLLQRGSPNRSRAAVFAVLAAVAGGGAALGAVVGAALADAHGVTGALVATGLLLPVAAVMGWPLVRRLDREGVVDERLAGLLRQVPPFALLPLAGLERVAAGMRPARFDAGDALMREGEPGDRFLVIESGAIAVSQAGRELARLGPGDGVGEIALLRHVPRTATVTAVGPVEAWAIDSATFLAAVGGHAGSTAVAEEMVEQRLHATPG
jgi:hypothetical protein